MANADAIEAVQQNQCARRRLGNVQLCAFLKRHKLPVEWAEAGFGAFNCVCRENPVDSGGREAVSDATAQKHTTLTSFSAWSSCKRMFGLTTSRWLFVRKI